MLPEKPCTSADQFSSTRTSTESNQHTRPETTLDNVLHNPIKPSPLFSSQGDETEPLKELAFFAMAGRAQDADDESDDGVQDDAAVR